MSTDATSHVKCAKDVMKPGVKPSVQKIGIFRLLRKKACPSSLISARVVEQKRSQLLDLCVNLAGSGLTKLILVFVHLVG